MFTADTRKYMHRNNHDKTDCYGSQDYQQYDMLWTQNGYNCFDISCYVSVLMTIQNKNEFGKKFYL